MKKRTLALILALVLVFGAAVGGTIAYLTSNDSVTNTFTVGKVEITLDEAKVNEYGAAVTPAARVDANSYKLIPGHTYIKDPTVHVDANSENCWLFVKVENGIANYEAATSTEEGGYKRIADQITANGWKALDGVTGVYYKQYTKGQTNKDFVVFNNFEIADSANQLDGWTGITPAATKIVVTAYAIQADGFTAAADAWANFGA